MEEVEALDSCWDFLDCNLIITGDPSSSSNFLWPQPPPPPPPTHHGPAPLTGNNNSSRVGGCCGAGAAEIDFSSSSGGGGVGVAPAAASREKECSRKRGRSESCSRPVTKACREKLRRERLNDRFMDLSSVLEPGRPSKADKPAILDDAIRVLNQLKTEAQELKETNEKLLEEIKSLKAEKKELREEKLALRVDKERMEQQLKAMAAAPPMAAPPPSRFMPAHPAAYHAGMNKMAVFPSYGFVPMWQYLPPATCDTSHDHELRPPAA